MHRASFTISCTDAAEASILVGAVEVEAAEGPDGTAASLRADGDTVHVDIAGQDVSGFRAAIHGVLRLLDAAQRTA